MSSSNLVGGGGEDEVERQFMELIMGAQSKMQRGDFKSAVQLFFAALTKGAGPVGEKNPQALSVIHSGLGNSFYSMGDFQNAGKHHQIDLQIAKKNGDHVGTAKAYANLGHVFKALSAFNEAIQCYEKQIAIAQLTNDKPTQCRGLFNIGIAYEGAAKAWQEKCKSDPSSPAKTPLNASSSDLTNGSPHQGSPMPTIHEDGVPLSNQYFLKAYKHLKQSLRLAESLKDNNQIGKSCGHLGSVCEELGNPEKSLIYFKKRLEVAQLCKDKAAEGRAYCNLGNTYRSLGEHRKAIECYEQDLAIAVGLRDIMGEAITCTNLGHAYQAIGNVPATIKAYSRHMEIVTHLKNVQGQIWGCSNLGRVHETLGNFQEAERYYQYEAQLCEGIDNPDGLRAANIKLQRVRNCIAQGIIVDHSEAVQALMEAVADDDDYAAPLGKQTIRGTLSRVFSTKKKARPSLRAPSLESLEMSDRSSNNDPDGDRRSITSTSLDGFSTSSNSPNPLRKGVGPPPPVSSSLTPAHPSQAPPLLLPDQSGGSQKSSPVPLRKGKDDQGSNSKLNLKARVKRLSTMFLRKGSADIYVPESSSWDARGLPNENEVSVDEEFNLVDQLANALPPDRTKSSRNRTSHALMNSFSSDPQIGETFININDPFVPQGSPQIPRNSSSKYIIRDDDDDVVEHGVGGGRGGDVLPRHRSRGGSDVDGGDLIKPTRLDERSAELLKQLDELDAMFK